MTQIEPFEAIGLIVSCSVPAAGQRFVLREAAAPRAETARVTNLGGAAVSIKWGDGTVTGSAFGDGHVTVLEGTTEPFTVPADVTHGWMISQTGTCLLHVTFGVSF